MRTQFLDMLGDDLRAEGRRERDNKGGESRKNHGDMNHGDMIPITLISLYFFVAERQAGATRRDRRQLR